MRGESDDGMAELVPHRVTDAEFAYFWIGLGVAVIVAAGMTL